MIWIKAPERRVSVTQTTTYEHNGLCGGISARSVRGEKSLVGSIHAFPEKTHLSAVGVTCENVARFCGNVTVEKLGSVCENEIQRSVFFGKIKVPLRKTAVSSSRRFILLFRQKSVYSSRRGLPISWLPITA